MDVRGLIILFAILIAGPGRSIDAASCSTQMANLASDCSYIIGGNASEAPSQACCHAISGADTRCVCRYVTPMVVRLVNMKRVVQIAAACGRTLPHGFKCGNYTVP